MGSSPGSFLCLVPGESSVPNYRPLAASDLAFASGIGLTTGNVYYLDPVNGNDTNSGQYPTASVQSFAAGYALLVDGHNDVLVLIGNGQASGTARLTAGFTWAKNAAHLVGVCAPGRVSNRARIAPPASGGTAFANFFTISGSGCFFSNLEFYQGFPTGIAAEICLTVSGGRNVFRNVHLAGMNDAVGAGDTGSRHLLISGNIGENLFERCTIGDDTTSRTAANASLEFTGKPPRNIFDDCIFPFYASGGGTAVLGIYAAASALDRWQIFKGCRFLNSATKSGGSAIAALVTLGAATGGEILLDSCQATGVTTIYSDSTTQNQIYLAGPVQAQVLAMAQPS
jgi:hypothetical protein